MVKDAPHKARFFTGWRIAYIITILISGIVYLPAMSGLPIWDDHALIGGRGIGGGKSLSACFTEPFLLHYFRPLVSMSFFFDHKVFGSGPFFYHQTNLLIHVATTLVCLLLFRAAFQSRLISVAGALAFAVQPAQVSTVAWIGGRTDSLCTLFAAVFAWALIRSAQSCGPRRAAWTTVSVIGFGLALLAKEQAISLLPLAPLAFRCFSSAPHRDAWREGARWSTPYTITAVAFIAAWFVFYPSPHPPVMHALTEQAALAGRTMTYYTSLLAAPSPSSLHLLSVGTLERAGFWSVLPGLAAMIALTLLAARSLGARPAITWFCAFLMLAVLPVCNVLPLPSLVVAPYRVGLGGPAAAALLAYLFTSGYRATVARIARETSCGESLEAQESDGSYRSYKTDSNFARLRLAAGCLALIWFGALTTWGAGQWQDERSIFSTIVRYDPDSIVGRFNLTTALLKLHKSGPALVELDGLMTRLFHSRAWTEKATALAVLRDDRQILVRIRENQGNAIRPEGWLAALYGQMGFAKMDGLDRTGARNCFEIGLAIDRTNEDVNLGLAQLAYDAGKMHAAEGYLYVALAARPQRAELHMLLGHTLASMGRWRQAQSELETWASLQPWSGQAHIEVAQARSRRGDYAGAQASLEYALAHAICDPAEVRARLKDLRGRAASFLN